ncbi:MAG: pyridoxamine 5'-phosphate oxidase family protein [Candidatus Wildermuthbacteria bacterium]|nr:pyridoxamine 5'-phosphate oxidase family protein [Candidatus Wildermuthbacteria bacterium]
MQKKDFLPAVFSGRVVQGRKIGRKLGYPTANLAPTKDMPDIPYGVYAGWTSFEEKHYPSMMSFGLAETVGAKDVSFEVCLLGYEGDLYGKDLVVEITVFLREMKKFNSLEELALAIKEDENQARQLLFSNLAKKILDQGYLMSLATQDDGGLWVSDLVYVYDDDFTVYWLSRQDARHSQAILQNPQAAAAITVESTIRGNDAGFQIAGKAEKLEGDMFEIAVKQRIKRGKEPPVKGEKILGKGESWYCLKPEKMEIIYKPYFGFEKQELKLQSPSIDKQS